MSSEKLSLAQLAAGFATISFEHGREYALECLRSEIDPDDLELPALDFYCAMLHNSQPRKD